MPLFYLVLRNGQEPVPDREGVELPDLETALDYAGAVGQELMRGREVEAQAWKIEIRDENLDMLFSLPFRSIDPTVTDLPDEPRNTVKLACRRVISLSNVITDLRKTMMEIRTTIGRSRSMPASSTPFI